MDWFSRVGVISRGWGRALEWIEGSWVLLFFSLGENFVRIMIVMFRFVK